MAQQFIPIVKNTILQMANWLNWAAYIRSDRKLNRVFLNFVFYNSVIIV